MGDYDIGQAFQEIEKQLIDSMIRNMKHHRGIEDAEGLDFAQWQAEQLLALAEYRDQNQKHFGKYFSTINSEIESAIKQAYATGNMDQEIKILEALKRGYVPPKVGMIGETSAKFFKTNERKINALIGATVKDMSAAETATLRMANDEYRKAIFNGAVYYQTGAGTLAQSVDMATKDFLSRGLACIQYANGALIPVDSYAQMAIRTATTRAYLAGESAKRDEWGINTVIVNKRGVACPRCLPWVGRVYYDDVWGNVPPTNQKYPLLSTAIAGGLYHPNCRDSHTTYFEGVSTVPTQMTQDQIDEANRVYELEQKQRYHERMIRKYTRLRDGSLDPSDQAQYAAKVAEWNAKTANFVKSNGDVLKRRYENEKIHGIKGFTPPRPIKPAVTPPKPVAPVPPTPVAPVPPTPVAPTPVAPVAPVAPTPTVVNTPPVTATVAEPSITMDVIKTTWPKKQYANEMKVKMKSAPRPIRKVWSKFESGIRVYDPSYRGDGAHYSPLNRGIRVCISKDSVGNGYTGAYGTTFHEFGHNIDYLAGEEYSGAFGSGISELYKNADGKTLGKCISDEWASVVEDFMNDNVNDLKQGIDMVAIESKVDMMLRRGFIAQYERQTFVDSQVRTALLESAEKGLVSKLKNDLTMMQRSDISDMIEAASIGRIEFPLTFGHGASYWTKRDSGKEAFAEMFSATITSPESLEQIKKLFPKGYNLFEEILGVIG